MGLLMHRDTREPLAAGETGRYQHIGTEGAGSSGLLKTKVAASTHSREDSGR